MVCFFIFFNDTMSAARAEELKNVLEKRQELVLTFTVREKDWKEARHVRGFDD